MSVSLALCASSTDLSAFRAPSKDPAHNRTHQAFLELGDAFPTFSSPWGCDRHGAKVSFNATLEEISKEMGMQRPAAEELVDLKSPPCGLVLKREYSDTSRDVYIPSHPLEMSEARIAAVFIKERTAAGRNDGCSWLCQEFVPFLSIGEIWFMCAASVPICNVVTGRHALDHPVTLGEIWYYERNDSLKTIAALQ